jgi:hypothetical protein
LEGYDATCKVIKKENSKQRHPIRFGAIKITIIPAVGAHAMHPYGWDNWQNGFHAFSIRNLPSREGSAFALGADRSVTVIPITPKHQQEKCCTPNNCG